MNLTLTAAAVDASGYFSSYLSAFAPISRYYYLHKELQNKRHISCLASEDPQNIATKAMKIKNGKKISSTEKQELTVLTTTFSPASKVRS